jgi:hypothetical protein
MRTAQKNGKSFLCMCLRIELGNRQRVCITKLLKSLYPRLQYSALLCFHLSSSKGVRKPENAAMSSVKQWSGVSKRPSRLDTL